MPEESTRSSYLPQLDGLRGLAALAVVLAHFNPAPLTPPPDDGIGLLVTTAGRMALGNLAVILFFALSGFLLTYLAQREYRASGRFAIGPFFIRRILRIWPLYFTVVAIAFIIQACHSFLPPDFGASADTWHWITNRVPLYALFAGNWSLAFNHAFGYVDHSPSLLRILWSIGVEEQFYVIYPFLILLALHRPGTRPWIALLVLLISWGFRLWFCTLPLAVPPGSSSGGMYYATLSYGDVLLAGSCAGWVAANPGRLRPDSLVFRAWLGPMLILLAVIVGLLWSGQLWYPYHFVSPIGYGLEGALFSLFLLWAWAHPAHHLIRFMASRPLRYLGAISYGIYMWHVLSNTCLATGLRVWASGTFLSNSPWLRLACSLLAAVAFATASRFVVELPFLRLKSRFQRNLAWSRP
jgi:peptidoglycan/LPS O-acetylase OafA/YrhL